MRVRFILTRYALGSGKVISAAREVFGNRVAKYANMNDSLTVECSADRFVRFMIARNEWGAENTFKDLKLMIISPEAPTSRIESFD